jgi:hypothetical protein
MLTITELETNTLEVGQDQGFTATLTTATPATYTWSTDGLESGQGTATAWYNWCTTCHTVALTVVDTLGVTWTATYTPALTLSLGRIADAIKDTLTAEMDADLLTRAYGYDELPEGINDAPSLEVYWQRVLDDATTDTDRFTFGAPAVRVKEITFYVDYIANPRNNLAENNAQLTAGASQIIDILETEDLTCAGNHCPPFGQCGIKTFRWSAERVSFLYGGVTYYAARFEIVVRVW